MFFMTINGTVTQVRSQGISILGGERYIIDMEKCIDTFDSLDRNALGVPFVRLQLELVSDSTDGLDHSQPCMYRWMGKGSVLAILDRHYYGHM